MKSFWITPEK